jgi:F0F1-type ATP synthase membrane subunit b/b'
VGDEGDPKDDPDVTAAEQDAADIVRLAFVQAERITAQAQQERNDAARILEEANAEAAAILEGVRAERDRLLADAKRDRVAAEEAMLKARADAEREADTVMLRATELARREAEILLDGSRMELLRARDEAAAIRATAERDAESIIAAATQRARATSAELLAATRRRLGDAPMPVSTGDTNQPAETTSVSASPQPVVDLTDDRPPPVSLAMMGLATAAPPTAAPTAPTPTAAPPPAGLATVTVEPLTLAPVTTEPVKLGGWAVPPEGPHAPTRMVTFADRRYRMNWDKTPTSDDIDVLVHQAVSKAVARSFARRRRRKAGSGTLHH